MSIVDFNLEGRIATINGASRGIGEYIARAFAERGATVVLSSRKQEALDELAASIEADGGKAVGIACHTGDPEQVEALFERVRADFGNLDIHVNNAAINPYFGPVIDTPIRAWDKTMEVNLRGYFVMTQNAARLMRDTGGGSIIQVASIAGLRPGPNEATYAMGKAAVINMAQSFAKDLGKDGIRVNTIAPGPVETRFAAVLFDTEEKQQHFKSRIPVGRWGQPEDVAGAAVYFASDVSGYVTGATLVVDGGLTA